MIYMEIIELKFCGLDYDLKKIFKKEVLKIINLLVKKIMRKMIMMM